MTREEGNAFYRFMSTISKYLSIFTEGVAKINGSKRMCHFYLENKNVNI